MTIPGSSGEQATSRITADWFDSNRWIRAMETEDEVGAVLRAHLALERLLDHYLEQRLTKELRPFIQVSERTPFGQKLAFAAAFGMPLPFLRAAHKVNDIRNKTAHKDQPLSKEQVDQLASHVDGIGEIDESYIPIHQRYLELPVVRPGKRMTFGSDAIQLDFLMAAFSLVGSMTLWMIALERTDATGQTSA